VVTAKGRVTVYAGATHHGFKAATSAVDAELEKFILASSGRTQQELMIAKTRSD
jgi:hypothetical protein